MKISITVSGVVDTIVDKKNSELNDRFYIKPINKRGMEEIAVIEAEKEEDFEKELRKYLKNCCVRPKSRTVRYIAPAIEKPKKKKGERAKKEEATSQLVYQMTLESYKALAPYLRKFDYII